MRCSYPNYKNSDVVAAYQRWKTDTVTSSGAGGHQRVQRPKEPGLAPNSTVSEGIGYGMNSVGTAAIKKLGVICGFVMAGAKRDLSGSGGLCPFLTVIASLLTPWNVPPQPDF